MHGFFSFSKHFFTLSFRHLTEVPTSTFSEILVKSTPENQKMKPVMFNTLKRNNWVTDSSFMKVRGGFGRRLTASFKKPKTNQKKKDVLKGNYFSYSFLHIFGDVYVSRRLFFFPTGIHHLIVCVKSPMYYGQRHAISDHVLQAHGRARACDRKAKLPSWENDAALSGVSSSKHFIQTHFWGFSALWFFPFHRILLVGDSSVSQTEKSLKNTMCLMEGYNP